MFCIRWVWPVAVGPVDAACKGSTLLMHALWRKPGGYAMLPLSPVVGAGQPCYAAWVFARLDHPYLA
ncbi:hypothetical protein AOR01nite_04580 [Acetobacter orleanensis]|uniref:Uncharacterized protein n=1 Tax=Acetobacter orleanensis TaxID=104099 RepID=A0A4Y3TGD0_9PROT|nr:hypothetical protein Abol_014_147 [Acetobacter orleanensis JCM 7639]GEB81981.1 hypothetical protein AOR01nite_04580 [Acetobacter orleanensis]